MTDVRALKDQATQYLQKGKLPAALEAWQKVAAATPDDPSANQKVAEIYVKLGKKVDAVKVYEAVARGYAEKGLFFKASAVARLISGLEPGHQRTHDLIAALFAKEQAAKPTVAAVKKPAVEIEIEVQAPPAPASSLPSIPLFSTLTKDELKDVLNNAMEVRVAAPGDAVVLEGQPGDSMFAVVEGQASVFRGWGTPAQKKVAHVATGEIFGEAAMVSGAPRLATVVTEGEAVVLEFKRAAMGQVIARFPHVGQAIDAFYRERLLANVLRASPILRALPESEKLALGASFQPSTFVDGQRIINEGQPADSVHLLLRGTCVVTHESGERYSDLREGDLFGEVSVLTDGAATASVAALGPVLTLRLSGSAFKAQVMKDAQAAKAVEAMVKTRLERTAQLNTESFAVDGDKDDLRV
jgi:CRP-like cAMP-binding protein